MEKKNVVRIWLAGWQMKLVKSVLGQDCSFLEIAVEHGPQYRYGVDFPKNPKVQVLPLTGRQQRQVRAELGAPCQYLELANGIIVAYGVPPDPPIGKDVR
jgi:hypothetical protein